MSDIQKLLVLSTLHHANSWNLSLRYDFSTILSFNYSHYFCQSRSILLVIALSICSGSVLSYILSIFISKILTSPISHSRFASFLLSVSGFICLSNKKKFIFFTLFYFYDNFISFRVDASFVHLIGQTGLIGLRFLISRH